MKTILFFLTLILGINQSNAQTNSEKILVGKWILVEEADSFPSDIEPLEETDSDSDFDSDSKTDLKNYLTFKNDGSILVNQMGNDYKATYRLKDSTLTFGNRIYSIIKLEKEELVYKEKDDFFDTHYYYRKLE
ncbi:hypothetical protein [Cesiribacter andamanensis]|uniref:Lipocalin-like domain-containing protein n=1 Tax=Cesiribacter andamanensis AMV16 TaxID=1279009 RepID=M7NLY3_9BACT|nr:hypothetical protein [Cesiribacter andamanensis]EMR02760.1 hypothetical protein ADICEAN_02088 [Cesiribacter andamanensis AMV16]